MSFHNRVSLDFPVSLGGYRHSRDPGEPMVLHLVHVPGAPNCGLDARAQFRAGRRKLLEMTYARIALGEIERSVIKCREYDIIHGTAGRDARHQGPHQKPGQRGVPIRETVDVGLAALWGDSVRQTETREPRIAEVANIGCRHRVTAEPRCDSKGG
jgi:hypothetical protein